MLKGISTLILFAINLIVVISVDAETPVKRTVKNQNIVATPIINQYVPQAEKVGAYRFTYLFWDIYDASLYAPGAVFSKDQPFALKLSYLRWLAGEKIAQRSAKEIQQQGFADKKKLHSWLIRMTEIFPDVDKDDTITGIRNKDAHTLFFLNGVHIGTIKDREFTERFFAIWLSNKTSQPAMRKKLLCGRKC